jgi:SHS2 domain-containing protein
MRYESFDHTADLMVTAYGRTLEECFANAGYALFDQTVDLSTVDCVRELEFEIGGATAEERLYAFLSELLFIEDGEDTVLKEISVAFDGDRVVCRACGETIDRGKHRLRAEVKAVTYHMMEVDASTPSVTVVFDV